VSDADSMPDESPLSEQEASEKRQRHMTMGIVFVTVFIDLLGFGIVLPLLPRYAEVYKAGPLELAALFSSFSAMQFIFAPIWGRVSDRVGRRPIILMGLASSAIFYAMFGFASSLEPDEKILGLGALAWLFVSRIGAGIAGATIPTAQACIADTTGRENRTKGMALIGMAFGIGFTFGPLIGAGFVSNVPGGPPSPWAGYVAAMLSASAFLVASLKLPESRKPGADQESAGHSHIRRLTAAMTIGGVGAVLLTMFMTTVAFAQFESTLALLTKGMKIADRGNFLIFAYVGAVLTLSQGLIVRRLATRITPQKLALGGTALMVVGLGLVGFAGRSASEGMLYAVLPIAVIGFSAVNPALQSLLSLKASADKQGEVLGVGQSFSALARIVGPAIAMPLHATAVELPHWTGAGLMAVSVLLVATLNAPDSIPDGTSEPEASPTAE
jgi:MFS transporter, DHA1 family, tetracycline resistance protein